MAKMTRMRPSCEEARTVRSALSRLAAISPPSALATSVQKVAFAPRGRGKCQMLANQSLEPTRVGKPPLAAQLQRYGAQEDT